MHWRLKKSGELAGILVRGRRWKGGRRIGSNWWEHPSELAGVFATRFRRRLGRCRWRNGLKQTSTLFDRRWRRWRLRGQRLLRFEGWCYRRLNRRKLYRLEESRYIVGRGWRRLRRNGRPHGFARLCLQKFACELAR